MLINFGKFFLRKGACVKSYMRKGFLIYEEMREYSVIYMGEAVSQTWFAPDPF